MRPDVLRWPAINRSAAGGSHGDQEVFDTDGVLFDKAELQETMVAGATLRPVDDAFTLDVMLQQLGVGLWCFRICMPPAALFCELMVNIPLRIEQRPSSRADRATPENRPRVCDASIPLPIGMRAPSSFVGPVCSLIVAAPEPENSAFGSELRERSPYADQLSVFQDNPAFAVRFGPIDLCCDIESIDRLVTAFQRADQITL